MTPATIMRPFYNWNTIDYIHRHGFLDRQDAHRFGLVSQGR
jgi:hypothetical protein